MNKPFNCKGPSYVIRGNVDTDTIIKSEHCANPDPAVLAEHCLDELSHPLGFADNRPWPIIVCQGSFGVGSARIQAPLALQGAGVQVVLASHFSSIFFENCLNGAVLLPIRCDVAERFKPWPRSGEVLEVSIQATTVSVRGNGVEFEQSCPLPEWALKRQSWMDWISARAHAAGGLDALRKTGLQG